MSDLGVRRVFLDFFFWLTDGLVRSWEGERRVTIAARLLSARPAGWSTLSPNNQQDESRVWLDIEVSDSGPGIPLDDQARLFTQFNDIQPVNARRSGGAGLGMFSFRPFFI